MEVTLQVQRLGSYRRHVFNERNGLKIKTFLGGSFPHVRSGQLSSVCVLVTLKWFMVHLILAVFSVGEYVMFLFWLNCYWFVDSELKNVSLLVLVFMFNDGWCKFLKVVVYWFDCVIMIFFFLFCCWLKCCFLVIGISLAFFCCLVTVIIILNLWLRLDSF